MGFCNNLGTFPWLQFQLKILGIFHEDAKRQEVCGNVNFILIGHTEKKLCHLRENFVECKDFGQLQKLLLGHSSILEIFNTSKWHYFPSYCQKTFIVFSENNHFFPSQSFSHIATEYRARNQKKNLFYIKLWDLYVFQCLFCIITRHGVNLLIDRSDYQCEKYLVLKKLKCKLAHFERPLLAQFFWTCYTPSLPLEIDVQGTNIMLNVMVMYLDLV